MRSLAVIALAFLAGFRPPAQAEVIDSPPFVIEFDQQDRAVAERTGPVLQQALARYAAHLPSGDDPIRVAIAPSMEAFEQAFGGESRNVQAFASGRRDLVMKPPRMLRPGSNYDAVLRHELIHVLIARNTDPQNMPRWFNEGVAMLVSNDIEWSGPTTVAWMYLSGNLISYSGLVDAFEDPGDEQNFGRAYAQSLSMTRYLYETLGEQRFWSFVLRLKELPFNDALRERTGMNPLEFYDAWKHSLRSTSWGSWLVSGFFIFQIAAVLLVIAYIRKRRRGQKRVHQWEMEEAVNAVFSGEDSSAGNPDDMDEYLDEWEEDEEGRWWL